MTHAIFLALVGFLGGGLGSMLGLGGGFFIVPALTLFLEVPIHAAIGASLVAIVATSATSAMTYLRAGFTNLRLGLTLETLMVAGALIGGLLGTLLGTDVLSAVLAAVMILVVANLLRRPQVREDPPSGPEDVGTLGASYWSLRRSVTVNYAVERLKVGLPASFAGGVISGLLGLGGGVLMVPVMVIAMRIPVRAAIATSSFMVGVTAATGATVYIGRGLADPVATVPVVLGAVVGAFLGSRAARSIKGSALVITLAFVMLALAIQMVLAVAGIRVR